MRANRLRQKLNAGNATIGTHILSSWPTLVELIGDAEKLRLCRVHRRVCAFHYA